MLMGNFLESIESRDEIDDMASWLALHACMVSLHALKFLERLDKNNNLMTARRLGDPAGDYFRP